ncbi:MAG TPA: YggT family protein [Gaiellaceae bacterium]|nr:YggT family protein [Gaiellaceae bacterium]
MGVAASVNLLTGSVVSGVDEFLYVFASVYTLVIFVYILTSWLRLPYSIWMNRIQRFLYDVCEPYIRLFRRMLPAAGPLDFSPMVAIIVLWIVEQIVVRLIDNFA